MERKLPQFSAMTCLVLAVFFVSSSKGQTTTVFNEDFTVSTGAANTTVNGPVGASSTWNMMRSGTDYGARIISGLLQMTDDATGAANADGWVLVSANTTGFAAPYNTTLASNPGLVTWTFNMRQPRNNPDGITATGFGVAYILAGSAGTTNLAGTGYAVVLGNSGANDPLKLVRYTAGLRNSTPIITSNTGGLDDFGKQHLSVRVTFAPSTNTWQMYLRNDNSNFNDPSTGYLTLQGTAVNNTYTGSALPVMGAYWNGGLYSNQIAVFDNFRVTVAVPTITSLSPGSAVAGGSTFTMTVNGTNFSSGSTVQWNGAARTTTFVSATQITASIPASDIVSAGSANITVANGTAISNTQVFAIDIPGAPTLSLSTTGLANLTTTTGTASSALTYTISGTNLTADPVVTPPANFEVSNNGTTYSTSLTLPRTGAVLTGQPVTLYARIRSSAPAGIYTGNIDHSTAGGTSKQVNVSGTVLAAQPTVQATAVSFTNVTSTTFTINYSIGNGASRIVLMKSGSAVNASPVDGTSYISGAAFGTGSEIGTGNFVVYQGTSNNVTVSGLAPASTYYVAVYELNGSGSTENYMVTTPATGNRTTLNAPSGLQMYTTNTVSTIDFDNTVDGVNTNAFHGDGISPGAATGELNSNAWAISGFSDGAVAFGATNGDNTDFDRGESNGNVVVGGIYAFNTSTATTNASLGIQPATGDFAPGTITLRFQNQTGGTLTSVNIGYKVYVLNNEAGASSFSFSHSANNSTYTSVFSGIDVVSPAAADAIPEWKASYRVVTLTGLSIASNNYYYIRWSGAAVSGTAFDEFALDDITIVGNPSTNYAPFNGTAQNFVLQGNATLTGSTIVTGDTFFNNGKLDINGQTLTLNGPVINNITGGLKGSGTSNLVIGGAVSPSLSFDQTTPNTTNVLNNLSINSTASNTTTILNPVVVNGTLTTALGQTLDMGTNALTGTLATISNNGTIKTQNTTALPLPSGKTWGGTGMIHYNAASAQQTVVIGTYHHLTVSTTGGGIAEGALTVNGILDLPVSNPSATTGSLSTGTYTLTMGGNATNTGIGDVSGYIARNSILPNVVYTFGHAHSSIFLPNVGTLPTSMGLKIVLGTSASWRPSSINRIYDFIQSGAANTKAVIKAHYLDSELNGNNESKLVDWAHINPSNVTLEQGRSNYNTTENWVELTNANIGLYFASTFNVVEITLDESEAGSLTWNGSVSNSWTTATNWTPNATPSDTSIVYIPDAATTPNDPTLNSVVLLGALNIFPGGILNAPDNSQFTINNGAGAWINDGVYNPGTGTSNVTFTNANATIAGETNFNNITINTGAVLTPITDAVMNIAGAFVNNGTLAIGSIDSTIEYTGTNQTIIVPNDAYTAYHNLVISGSGAIFPTSLNIMGDLTLNNTVDFTGTTIAMTGPTELQIINGSVDPSFDNLTIANSFGEVDLANNTLVSGTLTLTDGKLDIGNQILTLEDDVAGSFDVTNMIVASGTGEVRRNVSSTGSYIFPLGDVTGTAEYSPITVFVNSGAFSSAYIGASVVDAIHPNNASVDNNISRYWNVSQSGITGAVATITATYNPADITGVESDIAAAQLDGTFNQQTNPWVRYAALGSNTLSASAAPLTDGTTSAFTGLKGGAFTVSLTGYGSFCQNDTVTLMGEPTGGDAPYTYEWSAGLGTAQTATPPTSALGTINYTVTVKDSNGITATDDNDVEVLAPSVGGTLSPYQEICAGTQPGDVTLTGNVGAVTRWESSPDLNFLTPANIANTTNVLSGASIGPLTATIYFRAVVQNGTCDEVYSAPIGVVVKYTTWNGTSWSAGAPDAFTTANITGNYTASANFAACALTVSNSAVVVIPSGFDVTLNGALTVTSGSFTLENNANLLQLTDVANTGNIIVKRNSSAIVRQDYTLWSSPVDGQNLLAFSPLTVVSPTSRFYTYNSATNFYNSITSPSTTDFETGKGYLIRVRNNHPSITPTIWTGQFTGVPHNGPIDVTLFNGGAGFRFNLVGNPYPSPIDMEQFVTDNSAIITGTLYFWRKTNNEASPSYSSWTLGGGFVSNGEAQVFDPNGIIRTGQGFIVEGAGAATTLNFNNGQRVGDNANQFFRSALLERHRIWLNATGEGGLYSQMLVGYISGATMGVDYSIDGLYFNDGPIALNSLIDGEDYVIQGRPLPFDPADVVPLSFEATAAGTYNIAIDHVDGFFVEDYDIFLKDNNDGTFHDLREAAYTFTSDAGYFAGRFELVYIDSGLGVQNPDFDANSVVIIKQGGNFVINSGNTIMDNVKVFDIRGRLLVEQKGINASETTINAGNTNQVLIVKITSDGNQTVTRKVVN